jgi:nucleotide-binding universal stress UspA family protein
VYDNVIVPFDGTLPGRAALAPAADLAWRCGARIVIVNNTEVTDGASRAALKSRAMSLSSADVDFWVDTNLELGEALVEAARFRTNPIICIPARGGRTALRRRFALTPLTEQVLRGSSVPVLVVGPEADTSRGLPMTSLVATLDGSPESEGVLRLAGEWARELKLGLTLIGVVSSSNEGSFEGETEYLRAHTEAVRSEVPEADFELVRASDPVSGIVAFMDGRPDAVLFMSTHGRGGAGKGLIGGVALGVIGECKRAVVLHRARS